MDKRCTRCGSELPDDTQQKYVNAWCTRCNQWMKLDSAGIPIYKCSKCGARFELTFDSEDLSIPEDKKLLRRIKAMEKIFGPL